MLETDNFGSINSITEPNITQGKTLNRHDPKQDVSGEDLKQQDIGDHSIGKEQSMPEVRIQKIRDYNSLPMKNLFAIFLILFIPNIVMTLTFTIKHCHSSYYMLCQYILRNPINVSFSAIWFSGDIDLIFGFSIIFGYMVFALFLMVIVPGRKVYGPLTQQNNRAAYVDNGFRCYILSVVAFLLLSYTLSNYSSYSVSIVYHKFPSLLYCLNIFSLVVCLFLYMKGLYYPSSTDSGSSGFFFFDYYWGTELHPRICGVDLKIFTNCRCGMTVWALMIISYLISSYESKQIYGGQVVNAILQLLYITKFFWWEAGYYNTIDIILDRAGFYICWGCLVFVPSMYTLSAYYMASISVNASATYYAFIFIIGILSLFMNYIADYQKQVFRSTKGKCLIWGKPPQVIEAFYKDQNNSEQMSLLLVSGFWGLARHFHYLPELSLAFCWCASAGFHHLLPFTYFIYLVILLVHRVERDDKKCFAKYGQYYIKYKEMVPWKIIPNIY